MRSFQKDLAGGVVIILAAAAVGIIHNNFRDRPVQLLQKVTPVATASDNADATGVPEQQGGASSPGGTPAPRAKKADGSKVAADFVKKLLEDDSVYIIDARAPSVFEEGHIKTAINIPYDKLPDYYEKLLELVPMDAKVICYCWSPTCDFSDQLATELRIIGYSDVVIFSGGWEEWQKAGFPAEGTKVKK